jgi:sialic acid synthase SpsE
MIMNCALLIAELGEAHDGSLGILHSYIDALAGTGINIIKFQTYVNQLVRKASLQTPAVRATETITNHLPTCLLQPITLSINIDMAEGWLKAEAYSSTYEN